jgi:hypothetical protein
LARSSIPKTHSIKRNRKSTLKSISNPRTPKTPKSSPLTRGFGRGIKDKRTTKGSHKFLPSNRQEQGPENTPRNHQERAPKITTKNNREQQNIALRNHAESSIHAKEVHTRSSLPPDYPTLSQDLTMKLSSSSYRNPKKIGRENRKTNELGFQEMATILSPHGLYGSNRKSKIPLLNN